MTIGTMRADAARQLLLQQLVRRRAQVAPAVAEAPRQEPASFAQRRLWFIEQLQQVQSPYTMHAVQKLHFPVDAASLENALCEIVRRHEVLRTTFDLVDDEVVQRIEPARALSLRREDLRGLPPAEREGEANRRMTQTLARRFDLRQCPLLRVELYQLDDSLFVLLVAVHHIVFDGQSFQVFFQELETIYAANLAGRSHGLPLPAEQYGDFAREQRRQLDAARIEAEVAFWRNELTALPMLDLPLDRPRSRLPSFRGDQLSLQLAPALAQRLQQRAVAAQTTLFTVLLAGLAAALGRVCRQQDFAVGLPVTGRDSSARQQAIGFFVDTLVARLRWADDPHTDELLTMARDAMRRVLSHRQLPFELLVQHLQIERDLGVNPLFQVGFQLIQQPTSPAASHGTDPARLSAMFDLCIDLWPQEGALHGRLQFNADIFDTPTVAMIGKAFSTALHWLAEPGRPWSELAFDALDPAVPVSLLAGEPQVLRESSVLHLLDEVAALYPDAVALEDATRHMDYCQLVQRVEAMAGTLMARGLLPGSIVVIELPRSLDLVLLQLAILRAGAAFACLDPAWPAERRAAVRGRTDAPLVVDAANLPDLQHDSAGQPSPRGPAAQDIAYVISTSGSTGEPKGVVIEHRGLLNVAHAQRRMFGLKPGRRVAQLSSPTFDASIYEIVLALCSGATLVVAPAGIVAGEALHDFLTAHAIDTVVIPPSVLATADPARCSGLRLVCVAGESCPADLAARFSAGRTFWNLYGPTETTIWATSGQATVGAKVSIGRPIANLCTAVVDEGGRVVPVGIAGELCIAGVGVARGYLHEPTMTARVFVAAPPALANLSGSTRAYRTGDLVRQLRTGELVFLGRTDRQLKIRGLRIEPEEIELVLRTHDGVSDVLVDVADFRGDLVLVAYLQSNAARPDALFDACRELLRARLPVYMCPSHFVALTAFPRSTSGKIDRKALPPPMDGAGFGTAVATTPSTETERVLAGLMAQLLHLQRVGANDDFFRIGGHSLAAVQLASRVRATFGVELNIAEVFAHPTVAVLAARLDELRQQVPADILDDVPLVKQPRE